MTYYRNRDKLKDKLRLKFDEIVVISMNIERKLQEIGLTEGESIVYVSCLELGEAGITDIAKQGKIPRTSVFEHIKSLQDQGLIASYRKRKRKIYQITNPSLLKERILDQQQTVDALMPNLQKLYRSASTHFDARLLHGIAGMKAIRDEMLTEAKEILWCGNPWDMFTKEAAFFDDFIKRRLQKKIPLRAIFFNDSKVARERKLTDTKELKQTKIIDEIEIPSLMVIWNNKACLFTLRDQYKIAVIEDQQLVQVLRAMFEILWKIIPA